MNDFQIKAERYPGGFRHLASAMRKNSVRQHEFASLLRVLSSRFGSSPSERHRLRQAAAIARCKENKLRKLLADLGWNARMKRPPTRRFLVWFKLTKSAPVPLTVLLLTFITAKPVRGRIFDHFYPWRSPQPVNDSTHSLPRRLVRHSVREQRDEGGNLAKAGPTSPY
jgi:hypothetical protein